MEKLSERPLEINYKEILLLVERIRSSEKTEIVLKMAKAFLYLIHDNPNPKKKYQLPINEQESWIIAFAISPHDVDASGYPLGSMLLRKVFTILLAFDSKISPEQWKEITRTIKKGRKNGKTTSIMPYANSDPCKSAAKTTDQT